MTASRLALLIRDAESTKNLEVRLEQYFREVLHPHRTVRCGWQTGSPATTPGIIDMDVILKPENNHRTATPSSEIGADDKTDPLN